jgi:hypothetical protein
MESADLFTIFVLAVYASFTFQVVASRVSSFVCLHAIAGCVLNILCHNLFVTSILHVDEATTNQITWSDEIIVVRCLGAGGLCLPNV